MGTMRKKVDYSKIRGCIYTQSSARSDYEFWKKYDHKMVDREMGFAQRLNLNSARIFLNYQVYLEDKEVYLERVRDFVQTACICSSVPCSVAGFVTATADQCLYFTGALVDDCHGNLRLQRDIDRFRTLHRSEEHTSELQSR